jgi:hypothetical protein
MRHSSASLNLVTAPMRSAIVAVSTAFMYPVMIFGNFGGLYRRHLTGGHCSQHGM